MVFCMCIFIAITKRLDMFYAATEWLPFPFYLEAQMELRQFEIPLESFVRIGHVETISQPHDRKIPFYPLGN